MGEALTGFALFVVIAGGVMIVLTRRTRNKMRDQLAAEGETAPLVPKRGRRQPTLPDMEPAKSRPTIEELVAEEAKATGVNDIPGGEGLDVSLKLRVFWRDEVVRRGCEDGHLEYRVDDGVERASADTDDVRLVCVRAGGGPVAAARPPEAEQLADTSEGDATSTDRPNID